MSIIYWREKIFFEVLFLWADPVDMVTNATVSKLSVLRQRTMQKELGNSEIVETSFKAPQSLMFYRICAVVYKTNTCDVS